MGKLTEEMQRTVIEQKLGFVATVNADGTPNVSPKATFVVLDADHLAFGDLRSPNTIRNILERPGMEITFVDPFVRKGFRAKGDAQYFARGTPEFDEPFRAFAAWGPLADAFRGIVKLQVSRAVAVTSPAYDRGADEETLRAQWTAHFAKLNG